MYQRTNGQINTDTGYQYVGRRLPINGFLLFNKTKVHLHYFPNLSIVIIVTGNFCNPIRSWILNESEIEKETRTVTRNKPIFRELLVSNDKTYFCFFVNTSKGQIDQRYVILKSIV